MQAIILTGGTGSRLYPLTKLYNKHLVPINDKFIIDYPISTLKKMGITDVVVVLGGEHFHQMVKYLQDGSNFGLNVSYVYQPNPSGIAAAINLCRNQIHSDNFVVALGDNILEHDLTFNPGTYPAQIALYDHPELHRFGVASVQNNKIINIEEKPKVLRKDCDNYAIIGYYMFDQQFFNFFQELKPSARGEYEITHILELYQKHSYLGHVILDNSKLWSDAGTHQTVKFVSNYFGK